jgi:hypothetical protein
MRRILVLLTVALVMAAMMLAMAMPAFAQGGSENSCGASNPNIGFPPSIFNKGEEFFTGGCGFRNNPNYVAGEFPPGQ